MNLITRYIISCTNLYGIIHKDKVIEIFNTQNEEKISKITFNKRTISIDDIKIKIDDFNEDIVSIYNDYFVQTDIIEFDDPESLLKLKSDKPYYIPDKEELLKYESDFYFEKTNEYNALFSYIRKNIIKGKEIYAENICCEIQYYAQQTASFSDVFEMFEREGIILKDKKQAQQVVELITQLMNNTRLWENNGFTPNEMSQIFGKSHVNSISPYEHNYINLAHRESKTYVTESKVGRNAPCPCGSGLKYKKCCLNKEKILH